MEAIKGLFDLSLLLLSQLAQTAVQDIPARDVILVLVRMHILPLLQRELLMVVLEHHVERLLAGVPHCLVLAAFYNNGSQKNTCVSKTEAIKDNNKKMEREGGERDALPE